jgi:hypothetical protein
VHASIGIDRRIDWRRVLAAGLSAAAFVGLAGGAFELWRLGRSDAAAAARVERHVQERFAEVSANLAKVAGSLAVDRSTAKGLAAPADEARLLFDLVSSAVRRARVGEDVAVTIYDVRENVRAWVGRASEIAAESDRVKGPAAFFLAQSTAGLRLVYVEPVMGSEGGRVGTVAAEYVLSPRGPDIAIRPIDIDYTLPTAIAPVSLVPRGQGGGGDVAREGAFVLRAPSGEVLATASAPPLRRPGSCSLPQEPSGSHCRGRAEARLRPRCCCCGVPRRLRSQRSGPDLHRGCRSGYAVGGAMPQAQHRPS